MHSRLPALPLYLLGHAVLGIVLGLTAGISILAADAAGVRTLIVASGDPEAMAIFIAGAILTTLPLVIATAICLISIRDPQTGPAVGASTARAVLSD
ncbi:MAG: hypothetical protein IT562_13070 [Alphaproteobacteria bacterium]|nr:hypothetical protein [Alphaproteobacteria bacterium]